MPPSEVSSMVTPETRPWSISAIVWLDPAFRSISSEVTVVAGGVAGLGLGVLAVREPVHATPAKPATRATGSRARVASSVMGASTVGGGSGGPCCSDVMCGKLIA
jgi:hypothetical protein